MSIATLVKSAVKQLERLEKETLLREDLDPGSTMEIGHIREVLHLLYDAEEVLECIPDANRHGY